MRAATITTGCIFALFIFAAGCGGDDTTAGNTFDLSASSDIGAPAFDQGLARASEADVASILLTLNAGEVMVAQAAKPGLTVTATKQFAQMMIDMHSAAQTREMALFQQLGVTPNDANMFTVKLVAETTRIIGIIAHLAGTELDRFYADSQVDMHKSALDLVDFVLLPNAATPQLVTEIMTTRAAVVMHLDAAKAIQSGLASDGGI